MEAAYACHALQNFPYAEFFKIRNITSPPTLICQQKLLNLNGDKLFLSLQSVTKLSYKVNPAEVNITQR